MHDAANKLVRSDLEVLGRTTSALVLVGDTVYSNRLESQSVLQSHGSRGSACEVVFVSDSVRLLAQHDIAIDICRTPIRKVDHRI